MTDTVVDVLADRYAKACSTPSDIHLHLPRMVDLVELLDAGHVIELGSRSGVSTVAWLYGLQSTGGRLTSVDLDDAPQIGTWSNWDHVRGDDEDPTIIGRIEPADIVFIDTSHHYGHTVRELNTWRWMVKPGGVICGHDSELPEPEGAPPGDPRFPVKRAVEQFVAENGLQVLWYRDCWGFYVIRGF